MLTWIVQSAANPPTRSVTYLDTPIDITQEASHMSIDANGNVYSYRVAGFVSPSTGDFVTISVKDFLGVVDMTKLDWKSTWRWV